MSINRQPAQPTLSLTSGPTGVDLKVRVGVNVFFVEKLEFVISYLPSPGFIVSIIDYHRDDANNL